MIMKGQEQNVSSRPIVQMALQDPAWLSARATAGFDPRQFQLQLAAQRVGGSDHLRIMFTDRNPVTATAGVNAAVRAYVSDFKSKAAQIESDRGSKLSDGVSDLTGR